MEESVEGECNILSKRVMRVLVERSVMAKRGVALVVV